MFEEFPEERYTTYKNFSDSEYSAMLMVEAKRAKKNRSKSSIYDLEELFNNLKCFNHHTLPSLAYSYKNNLPNDSGVYFVYKGDEVYYIGQSNNMKSRWASHEKDKEMCLAPNLVSDPNLRIGWMDLHPDLLDFAEKYLIGLLHPVLNIAHREPV